MSGAALLEHWAEIEPLLDALLAVPEAQRPAFLDELPPARQAWRAALERLLRADAAAAAAGFLAQGASLLPESGEAALDPAAPAAAWQAGQQLGPWRLVRELGRGGMASVWLARPAEGEFQREVALKLPHGAAPQLAERFRRERDVLARLSHPGIARLFDAGMTPQGLPWLAMECVDGMDLLVWCEAQRSTVAQRLGLLLQICAALQYAHGRLVIHRDIKPANVLVQADGQVRLLDFGIARLLDAPGAGQAPSIPLTQLGQRPMTPEYASPEQVRGEEPGVASDVYALGVLAYRLLAGCSPYAGAGAQHRPALEQAILEFQPPPPSQQAAAPATRRALRGDLDTIVLKALAKEPARRYATVDALAADLRRHQAGLPVLARGPSWRYAAGRFVRRHRAGVAASVLAVLALAGSAGWALWSAGQARSEARRAESMYRFALGLFNPDEQTSPDLSRRDLRLQDLVQAGARRILTELQGEPRERLALLTDLAKLAGAFNLDEEAQRLHDEMVRFAAQVHGKDSVAYADVLIDQIDWAYEHQRDAQAAALADEALRIYSARGVADPGRLANAYAGRSAKIERFPAGDPGVERDLRASVRYAREDGNFDQVHVSLGLLARFHANAGRYDLALRDVDEALVSDRAHFGADGAQTVDMLRNRGDVLEALGRWAEAAQARHESLAGQRRVWGPEHQQTVVDMVKLSSQLLDAADPREGLALARQAAAIVAAPGWVSPDGKRGDIADFAQDNEIRAAFRLGRLDQARQLCERHGTAGTHSTPGRQVQRLTLCAQSRILLGAPAAAEPALTRAEALWQQYWPEVPLRAAAIRLAQGELALANRQPAAARARLRQAIEALPDAQALNAAPAWLDLALLAPADAGSVDAAALEALLDGLLRSPERDWRATHEALLQEALGRIHLARGDAQAALAPLERAVALRTQRGEDPDSAWLQRARQALAQARRALAAPANG